MAVATLRGVSLAVAVGLLVPAGAAVAQDLPRWRIAEICGRDAGYCEEAEARARQVVSGSWVLLPAAYRTACLDELKSPYDKSWRLLSQCLEAQTLAGLDKREIKTADTPVPPEPMTQAAPAAVSAPQAIAPPPAALAPSAPAAASVPSSPPAPQVPPASPSPAVVGPGAAPTGGGAAAGAPPAPQ